MVSLDSASVFLVLAAAANAQVVVTAAAGQPLTAWSSVNGSAQIPAGPLPGTGFLLQTPGIGTTASVFGGPLGGGPSGSGTGWRLSITLDAASNLFAQNSASATGQMLAQFQSQQPVDGVLFLEPSWSIWPALTSVAGDLTVDLDSNGTPDFSVRAQNGTVELPCTIGTTPLAVTLDWNVTGTMVVPGFQGSSGSLNASWNVFFVPATYALEPYASGCAPVLVQRSWYSSSPMSPFVTCVTGGGADMVLGGFLLGFGQQSTVLSLPPFCPLLVANPALVLPNAGASLSQMNYLLPHFQLPPGVQFSCQGIWLDTAGLVVTSGALRSR